MNPKRPELLMMILMAMAAALILIIVYSQPLIADFRSTFLLQHDAKGNKVKVPEFSSLSYLSDERSDSWRSNLKSVLKKNGDTHIDILARNTHAPWGVVNGVDRDRWRARLTDLRNNGLAPVIWMRGDDSEEIDRLPLANQIEYNKQVVAAVDDLVSHYTIALEADEYYSPQETAVSIQALRRETDKPIAVHLTNMDRLSNAQITNYITHADIFYVQTGFQLNEKEFREKVERAIRLSGGKPIVISEYHKDGTSSTARRYGDIACSYTGTKVGGVTANIVGTGNGRAGNSVCGDLQWALGSTKDEEWHEKWDDELAVMGLILVTLSAVEMLDLPFVANYNYAMEGGRYELEFSRNVTESANVGMTLNDEGRMMAFVRGMFDDFGLFKKGKKRVVEERK
jgi:hypothetical protein